MFSCCPARGSGPSVCTPKKGAVALACALLAIGGVVLIQQGFAGRVNLLTAQTAGGVVTGLAGCGLLGVALHSCRQARKQGEQKRTIAAFEATADADAAAAAEARRAARFDVSSDSSDDGTTPIAAIIRELQGLAGDLLSKEKSHNEAKKEFVSQMRHHLQTEVIFPTPGRLPEPVNTPPALKSSVFVQVDRGRDVVAAADTVHIYQAETKYNGAHKTSGDNPPSPGEAMRRSQLEGARGTKIQKSNPVAFELVNAYLANRGFNMYENRTETDIESVAYMCRPEGESHKVHILLQAAPPTGSSCDGRLAALANYLNLFRYALMFFMRDETLVLHATAIKGGGTGADVTWGFTQAALECQDELEERGVRVEVEGIDLEIA